MFFAITWNCCNCAKCTVFKISIFDTIIFANVVFANILLAKSFSVNVSVISFLIFKTKNSGSFFSSICSVFWVKASKKSRGKLLGVYIQIKLATS